MAGFSLDDIVGKYSLQNSLQPIFSRLQEAEQAYKPGEPGNEDCRIGVLRLLSILHGQDAAFNLRSKQGGQSVASELAGLFRHVEGNFNYDIYQPLVQLVLEKAPDTDIWKAVLDLIDVVTQATRITPPPRINLPVIQTPRSHTTSSLANSSEYRKDIDNVLKGELLRFLHADIPGFFEAFFGEIEGLGSTAQAVFDRCKAGEESLYTEEGGWTGWPENAEEKCVLDWLVETMGTLVQFAEEHDPTQNIDRRPLAQPSRPVGGSTAKRKLDIAFVDDPNATENTRCHWSQILVPGELKNDQMYDTPLGARVDLGRYVREVLSAQDSRRFVPGFTLCGPFLRVWHFDRSGGIASEKFDINKDGCRFITVMLGFLRMDQKQLGFDPTIVTVDGTRCIEIERNGEKELLVIDEVIGRAHCIAGRATTCWKVHHKGSSTQLVVKDSWQYPERDEEGKFLSEAMEKGVINVARYYHHQTIRIDGRDDTTETARKGLGVTADEEPSKSVVIRGKSRKKKQATGEKRSSDSLQAPLPPSKRTRSSSPTKATATIQYRVHRRVVVQDYGKCIYKATSRVLLLSALDGCIRGYQSLHERAGMIQSDISLGNLMVNEEDDDSSQKAFLIDLDLAVKEQREGFSGARGKTGTRAFMAIGVLYGEKHSFMHDLESFFWVLFWICIHYEGPGKGRVVKRFEKWNYMDTEDLAAAKKGGNRS
uniref:Fungal-type protein kinase domain-containing protein n=1 Tax=Coccidioides posadasii RMSCC 3488 TaxID=454284 RepID=A0A0J6FPS6_COCPO|nr:hypothetical protein CPAG_07767 [Coccidioides posadasii RMSCC 3488]